MRAIALSLTLACAPLAVDAAPDEWAAHPSSAELKAAWPAQAAVKGVGGRAAMRCAVRPDGSVTDCAVVSVTPSAMGFEAALLSLAPRYRIAPDKLRKVAPEDRILIVESWSTADTVADWRRKPTPDELFAAWPKDALRRGQGGEARINCLVAPQGGLYDCLVLSESPAGEHFGEAALALTPQLLFNPPRRGGTPVPGAVTIPIRFSVPPGYRLPEEFTVGERFVVPADLSWLAAPTAQDLLAVYPKRAFAAKQGGHVVVNCGFRKDGTLTACETKTEAPKGQGFAAAAIALAKKFRADPAVAAPHQITGGVVDLPVTFDPAAASAGPIIGKPVWTKMPDAELLGAATHMVKPPGDGGRAFLSCAVRQGGGLEACRVDSEEPPGAGLAEAAMAMHEGFRVATWTTEGLPVVGGRVSIPFKFQIAASPAQPEEPKK